MEKMNDKKVRQRKEWYTKKATKKERPKELT